MFEARNIRDLLKRTALAAIPDEDMPALAAGCQNVDLPEGAALYHEADTPRLALLVEGLLRVWIAADGRETTIRYARAGELLGVPAMLIGPAAVRVTSMSSCRVCFFHADTVLQLATARPALAIALARECAYNLFDVIDRLHSAAFGSIRQRLGRHLVDLATDRDGARVVIATAQQLAGAIGSVRETVSRALSDMRADGLIASDNGAIRIVDPSARKALLTTSGA